MARVKEITLTTSPTMVVAGDYIKASASITVEIEEGEDYQESLDNTVTLLKDAYKRTLLAEMHNITAVQKHEGRASLVRWLKKETGYVSKTRSTKKKKRRTTGSK